jgi:hypothetical protein
VNDLIGRKDKQDGEEGEGIPGIGVGDHISRVDVQKKQEKRFIEKPALAGEMKPPGSQQEQEAIEEKDQDRLQGHQRR